VLNKEGFPSLIYKNLVEVAKAEFAQSHLDDSPLGKINLSKLQDEITWIKYDHLIDLINRIESINDPRANIPWLVSRLSAQCFGALGYLLVSSSNAQEWRAFYTQYARMFGWHNDLVTNEGNRLLFIPDTDETFEHKSSAQVNLLLTCLCLRIWHISAPYGFNSMKVEINRKISPQMIKAFPLLEWTSSVHKLTTIRFPIETEQKPLIGSNERFRSLFQKEANLQLKMYGNKADLVAKVRDILRRNTDLQTVSLSSVADQLHMGERTLNRQLTEQNTTYKEIVSNFRSKLSLELLFVGQSIEKVALRVGFSERSTFERAFKKWQGFTPAQMQASYSLLSKERKVSDIIHPDNIPNLPLTATRLLGILNNDNSHIDELVEIVSQDPGLVAKVMQIAGSAFYANTHVTSLKQAILGVFGTEKLKSLALMLLSSRLFIIDSDAFDISQFWLQSLATAQISEDIGKTGAWGKQISSELYFVGLFYDLGSLFIAHCLPLQFRQINNEMHPDFSLLQYHDFQINRLGISSPQASAFLASYWNLPTHLTDKLKTLGQYHNDTIPHQPSVTGITCVASAVRKYLNLKNDLAEENVEFQSILKQSFFEFGLNWSSQLKSLSQSSQSRIESLRTQSGSII
jgi:HD-like signal output (HDOD) protein/AraC-like DNA-binding protein